MDYKIEIAKKEDYNEIIRLNKEVVHYTSEMDLKLLEEIISESFVCLVCKKSDEVVAFLISLNENKDYQSPNYKWFSERYDKFVYIDRVVVSPSHSKKGIGSKLYKELFRLSKKEGYNKILAEINIKPANDISLNFHKKFNFKEVGVLELKDKIVSLEEAILENAIID